VNAGYVLVGDKRSYPQIGGDYVKTFALFKSLPVDLIEHKTRGSRAVSALRLSSRRLCS
jgi:hypothetical protein